MPGPALALGQHVVGHRAQQSLGEAVPAAVGRVRVGANGQHLLAHQAGQNRVGLLRRQAGQGLGRREGEVAAEHRHGLDHLALLRSERVETCAEQRDQAGRDVERPELAGQHQGAVALDQCAAVRQGANGLDGIQGIPSAWEMIRCSAAAGSVASESRRSSIALSAGVSSAIPSRWRTISASAP
jgi:hypothetical protein